MDQTQTPLVLDPPATDIQAAPDLSYLSGLRGLRHGPQQAVLAEPGPVRGKGTLCKATLTRVKPRPARFRVIRDQLSGWAPPT